MKKLFDNILWWFMSGMLGVRKSASKGNISLVVAAVMTVVLALVVTIIAA